MCECQEGNPLQTTKFFISPIGINKRIETRCGKSKDHPTSCDSSNDVCSKWRKKIKERERKMSDSTKMTSTITIPCLPIKLVFRLKNRMQNGTRHSGIQINCNNNFADSQWMYERFYRPLRLSIYERAFFFWFSQAATGWSSRGIEFELHSNAYEQMLGVIVSFFLFSFLFLLAGEMVVLLAKWESHSIIVWQFEKICFTSKTFDWLTTKRNNFFNLI